MVKKVKRFLVFLLFSFFYSLLSGKAAGAASKVCLVPQSNGGLKYNGKVVSGVAAMDVANELCNY